MRLSDLLSQAFEKHADRIAMYAEKRLWTYAELAATVDALAAGLAAYGIQAGDRVAFLLPNSPELVFINLACCKLGAVTVPLNVRLTGNELAYILDHSAARLCIADKALWPILEPYRSRLATVEKVYISGSETMETGLEAFSALFHETHEALAWFDARQETPVAILYTSGTTARPKGVTHTQRSLGHTVGNYLQASAMSESDVVLGMLSMAHVFAYTLKLLSPLCAGAAIVVMPSNDPGQALERIARHRVTHLYGLPVMFSHLLEYAKTTPCDVSSLRYCVGGGDAIAPALNDDMLQTFGIGIHQACGMTEVIPYCLNRPGTENRIGTIGPPSPGMHVRLVDSLGKTLPDNMTGEIQVNSEALMAGYWNDPEATQSALDDGWFRTGDLGLRDDTGYYHFVGRSKEIIVSGGSNISPLEVEDVLLQHPSILEVAVVGKPDPLLAETVAAFVVPKQGLTLSAEDLLQFARTQLAPFKLPKTITFLDALPRGSTGKVHRKTLKDSLVRQG